MATGQASPPATAPLAADDLRLVRTPAPAVIVIFGATGDLTSRKLLPGLYSLAVQQLLPPETAIVGVARADLTDDEFRARMRAGVEKHSRFPVDDEVWDGLRPPAALRVGALRRGRRATGAWPSVIAAEGPRPRAPAATGSSTSPRRPSSSP